MYQLPPAAAAPGRRAPVFCASRSGRRRVGRRPLNAKRRRERLLLLAVRPAAAVAPEGVRRPGPPHQRLGAAEPVPDARDGRQPDVLQLDDLLLGEVSIRQVVSSKFQVKGGKGNKLIHKGPRESTQGRQARVDRLYDYRTINHTSTQELFSQGIRIELIGLQRHP